MTPETVNSRSPSLASHTLPRVPSIVQPVFDVSAVSLDDGLVMRMFEAFFQHVHPIPLYSFFHKASLVQRFEAGQLDTSLILSMIGMTCQLLDMGPGLREYGAACLQEAEALVLKNIGTPSVVMIQCLVLIIRHHAHQRRFRKAFMLFAIASRCAYALRLNYESPSLCFLAQESRRRLMWSLYIIDTTMAGGARELVMCPTSSIHIQLPCQERNFEFDLAQETEPLQPEPKKALAESVGSLGMYVRLLWLRHRILQTTKDAVLFGGYHVEEFPTKVHQLESELEDFEMSLPQSFRFSEKNLLLRAYSPRLCPYLLIHVWYRQLYCDLYRVTLRGLAEAIPDPEMDRMDEGFLRDCRKKCLQNGIELAEVFKSFKRSELVVR
ncbi:uncharacterized protein AB675_2111 [Cyphellophora attinorum]|uniref:Xylanolytic transcriptional activator regulatory domain-containing protein n=1 Tax=Cyphellophora attinorum TaxID=1664694 RepID=A0A0N1HDG7_9EURO|nr:uncharacterized protein AB675_2111 [Phialophora attinorum]KPI43034.1 hypothetical protein AB675_2111 [Phialophora attinorum]